MKYGKKTKKFCLDHPQQRQLMLCPTCHETVCKEGSKEDDCPKYCECDEGWRPPTTTPKDLKHKSHATLYYDRNQYPNAPSGFLG